MPTSVFPLRDNGIACTFWGGGGSASFRKPLNSTHCQLLFRSTINNRNVSSYVFMNISVPFVLKLS